MRKLILASLAVAGLALAGCSKSEQAEANRKADQAGDKISADVREGVSKVASDEDIQKAKAEAQQAARQAGEAVKSMGNEAKVAAADAAKDVASDTKAAIHEATAPTPEEKARAEKEEK